MKTYRGLLTYMELFICLRWLVFTWTTTMVGALQLETEGTCRRFQDQQTKACCQSDAFVEENSIDVEYIVRGNRLGEPWSLSAFITWDEPANVTGQIRYEVEWEPMVTVEDLTTSLVIDVMAGSCISIRNTFPDACGSLFPNSNITVEPQFVANYVHFGFRYRLRIRVLDVNNVPLGVTECLDASDGFNKFTTPDCYAETRDLEFCRSQPIIVSGQPVNVTIENIPGPPNELDMIEASLTWGPPVQVNGQVETYFIRRVLDGGDFFIPVQPNDTEDTVYQMVFDDLVNNTVYEFWIIPLVRPENGNFPGITTNVNSLQRGNSLSFTFEALIPNPCFPSSCLNGGVCVMDSMDIQFGYRCFCSPGFMGQNCEQAPPMPAPMPMPSPTPQPFPVAIVAIAAAVGAVVIIIFCVLLVCLVKLRKHPHQKGKNEPYVFAPQFSNRAFVSEKSRMELVAAEFKHVEIFDYSHIKEGERLGSGQYGEVFKGEAKLQGQNKWTVVAIKKPKNAISEEVIDDFKNEIRLMIELGKHPNIVGVLGCCTVDEPFYLMTDFMKHGDLLHFLRKCTDEENLKIDSIYKINTFNQLQIARQIADGMAYVSQTRFFHGDLAARNILVGDDLLVKITDFGLTDDLYQKGYTRLQAGAKRPYKWYSPESIEHQFCTLKTDIWSFGVLMWEILTFGRQTPYHGMSISEVLYRLKSGYRMPCPPQTPHFMEKLINSCWKLDPEERPDFANLHESVSYLLAKGADDANYIEAGEEAPTSPTETERKKSLIYILNLLDVDPMEVSGSADSAYIGSGSGMSASSFLSSSTFSGASVAPIMEEEDEVKEAPVKNQEEQEVKVDIVL